MKRFVLQLTVLGLVALVAAPVCASINFYIADATGGNGATVSVSNNKDMTSYTSYNTTLGGAFWTQQSSSNTALVSPLTEHAVFCIELFETFSWGTVTRNLAALENAPIDNANRTYQAPMTATAATMMRQLWAQYFDGLNISKSNSQNTSVGAFQIALWEIAYDAGRTQGVDLASGYFKATASTNPEIVEAQAMLTWLTGHTNAPQASLVALTWDGGQDFVGEVPEPAALAVWSMLGGLALAIGWRRRPGTVPSNVTPSMGLTVTTN